MGRSFPRFLFALAAALLLLVPASRASQGAKKKEKSGHRDILNFDGGILFETDGSLSELTCFRLVGRATAPHFFDEFKRIDDEQGTEYRSGKEVPRNCTSRSLSPIFPAGAGCSSLARANISRKI